jgi:hypothetical protein
MGNWTMAFSLWFHALRRCIERRSAFSRQRKQRSRVRDFPPILEQLEDRTGLSAVDCHGPDGFRARRGPEDPPLQ